MELVSEYLKNYVTIEDIDVLILVLVELVSENMIQQDKEQLKLGLNPCFSGIGFGVKIMAGLILK